MSTMITQSPKGVEDWYGERMHKRTAVEKIARKIAKTYHMSEIITPIFEHTILFQRGVGETTDVVQKEMYTFSVKSERSITLKPEGTAGVIRAYLEHGMYANSGPTKLFYVTPAFRYEQPQHGRLRQHHQFGVEFIGSHSPLAEVEVITLAASLIKELGLKDVSLHINSIGCKTCRKIYNEALLAYLNEHEGELCKTCKERMKKNPLRVLDCKEKLCHEIVKEAPRTIEYLDEECQQHFQELQDLLVELNIPFTIDTGIVRGLDYYTKTVFEFVNKEGFTLCGGGRYDGLIHEIDEKQDIPSVGFGMGIERILYFLEQENIELEKEQAIDLYIGILGKRAVSKAYKIVNDLRNQGYIIETDYMEKSIKAQMKYANKIGAKKTVIIGENELETQLVSVKDMETGENTQISLKEIGSLL
jgi:histidyl-tRNA synthetase